MADDEPPTEAVRERARQQAEQRRRRARVFGEVLPDTTADERDGRHAGDADRDAGEDWLRREVPPHHPG